MDPTYDYLGFRATQHVAAQAYAMVASRSLQEIDVAEVHDCFTWTEITNYEDLGFAKKVKALN
jgi:acetyl-CoA C-acetyltransferase